MGYLFFFFCLILVAVESAAVCRPTLLLQRAGVGNALTQTRDNLLRQRFLLIQQAFGINFGHVNVQIDSVEQRSGNFLPVAFDVSS